VDSMALLHLLSKNPDVELISAHFDHGIRQDSHKEAQLVSSTAQELGLNFELGKGYLGKTASEDTARQARYKFLRQAQDKYKADGIITAHHQDDLIETAFINLLRGTGRKGLASMILNDSILRPLLRYKKSQIITYAIKNGLDWIEDSTNKEEIYLRNYIRSNLMPSLTAKQRSSIIKNIDKVAKNEENSLMQIANLSHKLCNNDTIDRTSFAQLPVELGNELIVYWLRKYKTADFDRPAISRINTFIRTSHPGKVYPIKKNLKINITNKTAQFSHTL
jgi:tRNA(Ile)-lysidine synthetase-like protein